MQAIYNYVEKPTVAISKGRLVTARCFERNAGTVLVFIGWAHDIPPLVTLRVPARLVWKHSNFMAQVWFFDE